MPFTERQVERGRRLVANLTKARWELGDLALEVAPDVDASLEWVTSPAKKELEDFAEEIGLSYDHLRRYRRAAQVYPKPSSPGAKDGRRSDVSWEVHQEFIGHPKALTLLHRRGTWTIRTAREYLDKAMPGGSPTPPSTRVAAGQSPVSGQLSREQRVQIAKEAIKDPAVRSEVFRETEVQIAARKGSNEAAAEFMDTLDRQQAIEDPEAHADKHDGISRGRKVRLSLEFRSLLMHARSDVLGAAERWREIGGPLDEDQGEDLLHLLDSIRNAVDAIRDNITSGVSFDEGLAALLEEGV